MILIQTYQIISGPASTEQHTTEQVRYQYKKYTVSSVIFFQELGISPKGVTYALQETLKEELDRKQKQQITVPLGMDKTSKWCNSLILFLKLMAKYGYVWTWTDLIKC